MCCSRTVRCAARSNWASTGVTTCSTPLRRPELPAGSATRPSRGAEPPETSGGAAARSTMPGDGRVIAVFQPRRYSRTRALYREFGASFSSADAVLVTEVYGAGEMPQPGVNGKLIVDAICETRGHPEVYYIPQQDVIPAVLQSVSRRGDLVLTLGAGDISKAGEDLLGILEERGSRP